MNTVFDTYSSTTQNLNAINRNMGQTPAMAQDAGSNMGSYMGSNMGSNMGGNAGGMQSDRYTVMRDNYRG